jgi:hypothetical protein
MESLRDFYDIESQSKREEKNEDIENSIQNSLLYNHPTNRYNYYEVIFNDCFWVVPFGIVITMIIIVMVITVIVVKKLI